MSLNEESKQQTVGSIDNKSIISNENSKQPQKRRGPLFIAVLLIVLALVIWHLFIPASMMHPVFTGAMWGVLTATISLFCVGFLFVLLMGSIGVLLVAVFSLIWLLVATILFPVFFPILIPLAIVMLFVAFFRKRKKDSK